MPKKLSEKGKVFMPYWEFNVVGGSVGLLKKSKVHPPPPRGLVGLAEKSKVHPPPVGGSLGNLKTSKVHGGGDQVEGGGATK